MARKGVSVNISIATPNISNKAPNIILISDAYHRLLEYYGPQDWWPGRTRFEVIVGAILTQNTAWSNVEKAIRNLSKHRLLSPARMKNVSTKILSVLIKPSGYYNIKTKRLKAFVGFLFSRYGGSLALMARQDTASLRKELLAVHGIGPETCDSILLYAFGRPVFVVDAYTRRIFSRHALFDESEDYEEVQKVFTGRLPRSEKVFNDYHALIVRLGKDFCRKKRLCNDCPLKKIACN